MSSEEACRALVGAIKEKLGRLDIVVNNAGVGYEYELTHPAGMADVAGTPPESWREVIAINLSSVYNVCHHALPVMTAGAFFRRIVSYSFAIQPMMRAFV